MAIEKTALYSDFDTFYEWLNENALGVYFDTVQKDSYKIYCKCGEKNFITFTDELADSSFGIIIETLSGSELKVYSYSLKDTGYAYGWKTNSGLALAFETGNAKFTAPCFFITKDNLGNTAVIRERDFFAYSSYNVAAETQKSFSLDNYLEIIPRESSMTSLCPIVISEAEGSFTPNVFCTPYTQYSGEAILEINGTKYLSNGVFVMKD